MTLLTQKLIVLLLVYFNSQLLSADLWLNWSRVNWKNLLKRKRILFLLGTSRDRNAQYICCYDSKRLHHNRCSLIIAPPENKTNNQQSSSRRILIYINCTSGGRVQSMCRYHLWCDCTHNSCPEVITIYPGESWNANKVEGNRKLLRSIRNVCWRSHWRCVWWWFFVSIKYWFLRVFIGFLFLNAALRHYQRQMLLWWRFGGWEKPENHHSDA